MIAPATSESSVPHSLDNDLDDFDRLTATQVTQSPCRSIISQESNFPIDDSDIRNGDFNDQEAVDGETIRESDGITRTKEKTLDQDDTVKVTLLKSISSQLRAAYVQKTDSGAATCLTVSQLYIAVGTAHGVIFCFDKQQVMRLCLRKEGLTDSVTSMAIRSDSTRLVAGYSKGSLGLWSLENGHLISLYSGAELNYPTPLLLKFASEPDLLVFSNTGGSVFQTWVQRRAKTLEPLCIFSGSRGEVLHLDTLIIPSSLQIQFSSLRGLCLVALATVTKVIVISLLPLSNVHFYHSLTAEAQSPPVINWKFVSIQINSTDRVLDPVLAFGRGQSFSIYQISVKNGRELSFIFLRRFNLDYSLINMFWFTSKIIATLDKYQRLHVIDLKSGNEISNLDLTPIEMTLSSQFFDGSHIDGQVSGAMAAAGSKACYNSAMVTTINSPHSALTHISLNQLLLLGRESMVIYSLRTWEARIDWLVSLENHSEGLALALNIYSGQANSVIGLVGSREQRKLIVAEKIVHLIDQYLTYLIDPTLPLNYSIPIGFKKLSSAISFTIEAALSVNQSEVLWTIIYERCKSNTITSQIYLDSLKSHIIKGSLTTLPPTIAKDLINLFDRRKNYSSLESIIICLAIDCLDIHQVTTICRSQGLHRGLIYIYNEAFNDFTTPLELLLKIISFKLLNNQPLTREDINLGNIILLYVSCCLTGRKFHGDSEIPEALRSSVRQQTIKFLIRFKNPPGLEEGDETQGNEILDCTFYPNLKALLLFDVKDFLNVLALAMDKDEFDGVEGLSLTEVLIHVMTESCGFSAPQIGSLYIFLARMVSKPRSYIKMSDELVNQIVESLTESSDAGDREERQQALMQLVTSDKINTTMVDKILTAASKAKFFQVCEHIHWQRKQYPDILICYLSDEHLRRNVFELIDRTMSLNEGKVHLMKCLWENIGELIEIDECKATNLIFDHFVRTSDLEDLLNSLESKPLYLMRVLKCLLHCDQMKVSKSTDGLESPLRRKCSILYEPWIHEKFIELLCNYEPDGVVHFLESTSTYRSSVALQICSKANNQLAKSILFEREEKFSKALDLLLARLDSGLDSIPILTDVYDDGDKPSKEPDDPGKLKTTFKSVIEQFNYLIQFAERCSKKLTNSENREFLWFPLLQRVNRFNEAIEKRYTDYLSISSELCNNLFNSMMGYISMLTLLTWILESSITDSESIGQFSKIRFLLTAMLDAYNEEAKLLTDQNASIRDELHSLISTYLNMSKCGLTSGSKDCGLCYEPCDSGTHDLIIFQCHSFHINCLPEKDRDLGCPRCNQRSPTNQSEDAEPVGTQDISSSQSQSESSSTFNNQPSTISTIYDEFIGAVEEDDTEEIVPVKDSLFNRNGKFTEWEKLITYLRSDTIPRPVVRTDKTSSSSRETIKRNQFTNTKSDLILNPRGYQQES